MRAAATTVLCGLALASSAGCRPEKPVEPSPTVEPAGGAADASTPTVDATEGKPASGRASEADALMWAVLRGADLPLDRAEGALEAALASAEGETRTALALRLGRFYNVRALRGDASRAGRQAEVYAKVLGSRPPSTLDHAEFRAWCFAQLGALLAQRVEGRMLAALATVRRVEDALAERVEAHPDDIELHALAGNFAVFFAGHVPFDKRARAVRAEAHLTAVHERFDEMRHAGRDPEHCPNTHASYAFELAETRLALGDPEGARVIYEWVIAEDDRERPSAPIAERVADQIRWVAGDRLARLDELSGDLGLMPPWPSDSENCVVCHGSGRQLSLGSLYRPPARREP